MISKCACLLDSASSGEWRSPVGGFGHHLMAQVLEQTHDVESNQGVVFYDHDTHGHC